jgi:hypothetical protein
MNVSFRIYKKYPFFFVDKISNDSLNDIFATTNIWVETFLQMIFDGSNDS